MAGRVTALVGGQFGSEGKGVIAHYLADEYAVHVRTGGPNAGHSFNENGVVYKHQMLPCGWTNRDAILVLGAGALIDPVQLEKEISLVSEVDPSIRRRVFVDPSAMLIEKEHHEQEGGIEGEIHQRIGSTGEGVGAARVDRVNRDPSRIRTAAQGATSGDYPGLAGIVSARPVVFMLQDAISDGNSVLLEGTQGSGLSLIHGPWPYVTSNDTNAAQLCSDAGIAPHQVTDVIMVIRSYPIRVAGNSGPLKNEISWDEVSRRLGREVIEQTTVTKKVRRVGEWDEDLVTKSMAINKPTMLAVTFADYIDPNDEGKLDWDELGERTQSFVNYLERYYSVPVSFVGTGGDGWKVIDRR